MSIYNYSLKPFNTFGLTNTAQQLTIIDKLNDIPKVMHQINECQQSSLILGEGSNVLFVDDFSGNVLINRLKGIEISDCNEAWKLHVAAGENWHQLVCYTLYQGFFGLENLALIPGCVGSAPIQNIGAYGVEFEKFCEYVDVMDLNTLQVKRLKHKQCQFGYRESIFKHQYADNHMIIAVGLSLPKTWQPIIGYKELQELDKQTLSPYTIFERVCTIRRKKLPDPKVFGNAGSFFKNPLVTKEQLFELQKIYPAIPYYSNNEKTVKIAAAWLIEQCQLKGYGIGDAAVSTEQALVIINRGTATAADIIAVAHHVWLSVQSKFKIILEPEVRFINKDGPCNALDYLCNYKLP